VLFIAAFAFLLASFPARNRDLWMHLAAGRDLVEGQTTLGTTRALSPDPQVYHTWLYDLLSYGLYSTLGDTALVLLKALLVVGLALVLLRLSWTGPGWLLPSACTVLALLAMSPRLFLQPATVSYLFLALTLWLVWPRSSQDLDTKGPVSRPSSLRSWIPPWPLLVLFVVWANVDSRFVVGLGLVALVWLGQLLDRAGRAEKPLKFLACLPPCLLVSLSLLTAVCLLNPSHVFAFALPPELGRVGSSGPLLAPLAYLANLRWSPAGVAYFLLLALGLFSFAVNLPRWHWQRFLPWFGLALWGALEARAVPFFAVVAGPVVAWNLQDAVARLWAPGRSPGRFWQEAVLIVRPLAVMAGLALLVCAWPGWLLTPPFEPRRWDIETPPSLERGAAATRRWHQEGKLGPDARGLHLSPETAYAFAWFCPEENGLLDEGLAAAIRGTPGAAADWAGRMRAAKINHVIVYDRDGSRLFHGLESLLADPQHWPLLYLEGNLAVFGWRDPKRPDSAALFRDWELDLNRLAFHPAKDKKAPRARPRSDPEPRIWWEAFWKPAPPRSADLDEAALHLFHAEALRRWAPLRHLTDWRAGQTAGLVGAAGGWKVPASLLDAPLRLGLREPQGGQEGTSARDLPAFDRAVVPWFQRRFTTQRGDTPPGLLFLAVRAARRALAANPNDAQAYLILGESYLRLLNNTSELVWRKRFPQLEKLRQAQASFALNQAVLLKPDLAPAHLNLTALYREMRYFDLALEHQREHLKLLRRAGPPPGFSDEEFQEQAEQAEQELDRQAEAVEELESKYAAEAPGLRVLDRAVLAAQLGLAKKARDLLLESDIAAFGRQGMGLELELLLRTGRARDVREWTGPEQKEALGPLTYHWLRTQALAAAGDYALAEEELSRLVSDGRRPDELRPRERMAALVAQAVLAELPGPNSPAHVVWRGLLRGDLRRRVAALAASLKEEANANVLRGLLFLEEGEVDEAEVAFRLALAFWKNEAMAASGGGLEFDGRIAAQGYLDWLE
jgi:hypothetical protein